MRKIRTQFRTLLPLLLSIFMAAPLTANGTQADNPTWDGTLRRIHTPILMYHYVEILPADADEVRTNLTVTPDNFRQQMQMLKENGYTTISLYDLHEALLTGVALPEKPIILTFDDGYRNHYANVLSILQDYGFTGTFFIITARLDEGHPSYLSWDQAIEMANAGMFIEPHTKTHQDLRNRDYDFLVYEIAGSLQSVAAHTNAPTHMFAYPAGRYDDTTLRTIATMPIYRAVTTQYGSLHTTDNQFELPRIRVSHNTSTLGLLQMLTAR